MQPDGICKCAAIGKSHPKKGAYGSEVVQWNRKRVLGRNFVGDETSSDYADAKDDRRAVGILLGREYVHCQGCAKFAAVNDVLFARIRRPIVGANGLRQTLHLEKTTGYAEQILRNFAFGPDDAFIIISTSGIREVIVEMAEGAKRRGLPRCWRRT